MTESLFATPDREHAPVAEAADQTSAPVASEPGKPDGEASTRLASANHVSCQGRYSTGDFKGAKCIERAKERRYGVTLCAIHAQVLDRWMRHGFDYAWSITKLEWRRDPNTGVEL